MLLSTIGIRGAACRGREWQGVAGPGAGALFPAHLTRASVVHCRIFPVAHQRSDTQHTRFRPLWAFATALAVRMTPLGQETRRRRFGRSTNIRKCACVNRSVLDIYRLTCRSVAAPQLLPAGFSRTFPQLVPP